MSAPSSTPNASVAGKYLTFQVADEEYGIEINAVREIIGSLPITPVPGSPPEMMGVVNLRGKVIPVVYVEPGGIVRAREGFRTSPATQVMHMDTFEMKQALAASAGASFMPFNM